MICSLDAEAVVAAAVEGVGGDAAEVADTGQGHVEEPVEELPHAVVTESDLHADVHALAELEVRDGLLGDGGDGLLAGDGSDVLDDGVQGLGVVLAVAAADGDDDLVEASGSA